MSKRKGKSKSINQLVGNRGSERGLNRADAFTAYVMDRLLYRLGRSKHDKELYLKGGLLVANLAGSPHRFTRDIDMLRHHGHPSPDDLREIFRDIVAIQADDGITFKTTGVRAVEADHDEDGYDGVKVSLRAQVERREVEVRIDIGFGDAVVPPATRISLAPFLEDDEPAVVLAYDAGLVIAEKVETLLTKFPVVLHRLKDILDVVILAEEHSFDGKSLTASFRATFERRRAVPDAQIIDDMREVAGERQWQTAWATMIREKAVSKPVELRTAIEKLDRFVRRVINAVASDKSPPLRWEPGGPWRYPSKWSR